MKRNSSKLLTLQVAACTSLTGTQLLQYYFNATLTTNLPGLAVPLRNSHVPMWVQSAVNHSCLLFNVQRPINCVIHRWCCRWRNCNKGAQPSRQRRARWRWWQTDRRTPRPPLTKLRCENKLLYSNSLLN